MGLKETYNKIAEAWDKEHTSDTWWVSGTDRFISLFKKGEVILDAGCGAGWKSKYLSEKGLKVEGTDFSEKMIELAQKRNPNLNFFISDIKKKINTNKKYDGVFVQAVLLHIPKKEIKLVLKNLLAVLKKGGYLYIAVKELKGKEKEEKFKKEELNGFEFERFFSFFKKGEIEEKIKEMGSEIIFSEVIKSGNRNWIQIIAKK